jgi:serine/threonine protein kinase
MSATLAALESGRFRGSFYDDVLRCSTLLYSRDDAPPTMSLETSDTSSSAYECSDSMREKARDTKRRPSVSSLTDSTASLGPVPTPPYTQPSGYFTVGHLRLRYSLGAPLGKGSFGNVFHAVTDAGQAVAVKVYNPEKIVKNGGRVLMAEEQFLNELAIKAKERSRNIVTTLAVDAGKVVMELVQGPTLAAMMASHGPPTASLVAKVARNLMGAVAWLHRRGLVHRDIKLENVLFDESAKAFRLIDFNMVATRHSTSMNEPDGTSRSFEAIWCERVPRAGTPYYLAPEFYTAVPPTDGEREATWRRMCASDVWATALTVFWFAAGRRTSPFPLLPDMYKAKSFRELGENVRETLLDHEPNTALLETSGRFPRPLTAVSLCVSSAPAHFWPFLDAALEPNWTKRAGARETQVGLRDAVRTERAHRVCGMC